MNGDTTDSARILRARARELAQESAAPADEPSLDVVEFTLAGERYAAEVAFLREVQPLRNLTPLPCTPAFVRGLVNVRGRILAVIDLKRFFDLPETGLRDLHLVIVVQAADMELGILADDVVGSRTVPVRALQPALPTLTGIGAEFLKGVTADRLIVLDAARIASDRRIIVRDEVEA